MIVSHTKPDEIQIVVVGHVDHGKSTLIGRLLLDCHQVSNERLTEAMSASQWAQGTVDPSLLTDQLSMERQQKMTVDMAQAVLRTPDLAVVFIDTPGHRELLGNMLSGTGMADAAILVVDAQLGIEPQTVLHAEILSLLGVSQIFVAINKMDLVNYDEQRFEAVTSDVKAMLQRQQLSVSQTIPVSARLGDGVVTRSNNLDWYMGPTLLNAIRQVSKSESENDAPLCCPIQDVFQLDGTSLFLARIESGSMQVGEQLTAWPSRQSVTIKKIHRHNKFVDECHASECVGLEITSEKPLGRGFVLVRNAQEYRPSESIVIDAVRVAGIEPRVGQRFTLQSNLTTHIGLVDEVDVLKPETNTPSETSMYRMKIDLSEPGIFDSSGEIQPLHRLILAQKARVWGVGVVRHVDD